MDVALGVAPHTGWAVAVIVGGTAAAPLVLHRERVLLCPDDLPRQVFHAAQGQPLAEAADLVAEVEAAVERTTAATLGHLVEVAAPHRLVAVGLLGTPREMPELERALSNHSMLHTAEGELYRGAVDDAAHAAGLPVAPLPPKHAVADAAVALGTTAQQLSDHLRGLRAELGAPWAADHRLATAAALVALIARAPS